MASPEQRLAAIVRVVAAGMLFCMAFSGSLWISTRPYPLTPVFGLVPPFPWPLDAAVAALLVGLLGAVIAWPPSIVTALMSAWMPAPPPESDPAMMRTRP
jgi:Mn2+/Fe2+ NRAMP family transporter